MRRLTFVFLVGVLASGCPHGIWVAAKRGDTRSVLQSIRTADDLRKCGMCEIGGGIAMLYLWANPLGCAARGGRLETMNALIARGAGVNDGCDRIPWWMPPIVLAAYGNHVEAVRLLLEKGADPNGRDSEGLTALIYAAFRGNAMMAQLLLDAGADPDAAGDPKSRGKEDDVLAGAVTAMKVAERRHRTEVVRVLLTAANDPERKSRVAAYRRRLAEPGLREARLRALAARRGEIETHEKDADAAAKLGQSQQALEKYLHALRACPPATGPDARLRAKIVDVVLAMNPRPAVGQDAQHHAERARAFTRRAEDAEGYRLAAAELEKALLLAPWWGQAYYNLGMLQDKIGEPAAAMQSLRLYLRAEPSAADAAAVRRRIVDLEVALELANRKAADDAAASSRASEPPSSPSSK